MKRMAEVKLGLRSEVTKKRWLWFWMKVVEM